MLLIWAQGRGDQTRSQSMMISFWPTTSDMIVIMVVVVVIIVVRIVFAVVIIVMKGREEIRFLFHGWWWWNGPGRRTRIEWSSWGTCWTRIIKFRIGLFSLILNQTVNLKPIWSTSISWSCFNSISTILVITHLFNCSRELKKEVWKKSGRKKRAKRKEREKERQFGWSKRRRKEIKRSEKSDLLLWLWICCDLESACILPS